VAIRVPAARYTAKMLSSSENTGIMGSYPLPAMMSIGVSSLPVLSCVGGGPFEGLIPRQRCPTDFIQDRQDRLTEAAMTNPWLQNPQ
jgi:hypothetical protein